MKKKGKKGPSAERVQKGFEIGYLKGKVKQRRSNGKESLLSKKKGEENKEPTERKMELEDN